MLLSRCLVHNNIRALYILKCFSLKKLNKVLFLCQLSLAPEATMTFSVVHRTDFWLCLTQRNSLLLIQLLLHIPGKYSHTHVKLCNEVAWAELQDGCWEKQPWACFRRGSPSAAGELFLFCQLIRWITTSGRETVGLQSWKDEIYTGGQTEGNPSGGLCWAFWVCSGGSKSSAFTSVLCTKATDLPGKSPGSKQFSEKVSLVNNRVALPQISNVGCSGVTSGLGATLQGKDLLPHVKCLRLDFALGCTLAIPLDVPFPNYLGAQGETWPYTQSWNKDHVTMMLKWDFCRSMDFILCGFLPQGKSDPQA